MHSYKPMLGLFILALWSAHTIHSVTGEATLNCLQRAGILFKTCSGDPGIKWLDDGTLSIDLSNCKYSDVPSLDLTSECVISQLSLTKNSIKLFQNDSFKGQNKLRVLNLSQNPFCYNSLPVTLFNNMTSLKTLYLQPQFDHQNPCLRMKDEQMAALTNLEQLHVYGQKNLTYLSPLKRLSWLNLGELDGHMNQVGCTIDNMKQLQPLMELNISRLSIRWCDKFNLTGVKRDQTTVFHNLTHVDVSYNSIGDFPTLTSLFGPRLRVLLMDALCNLKTNIQNCSTTGTPLSNFNITTYSVDNYLYIKSYFQHVLCGEDVFGEALPHLRYLSTSELSIADETDITKSILKVTSSKLHYLEYWRAYDLFTVQTRPSCPVSLFQKPSFNIFEDNDLDKLPIERKDGKRVLTNNEAFPIIPSLKTLDMPSNRKSVLTQCIYHPNNITMINQSFILNQQKLNRAQCKSGKYTGLENVKQYYCDNCAMEEPTKELKTAIDIAFVAKSYPNLEHLQLKSSVHQTFNPGSMKQLKTLILDGALSNDQFRTVTSNLTKLPAAETISFKGVRDIDIATVDYIPENLTLFDLSATDIKYLKPNQRKLFDNHFLKQSNFRLRLQSNGLLECSCSNTSLVGFLQWVNKSTYVVTTYTCNKSKSIQDFLKECFPSPSHYWYMFGIGGAVLVMIIFFFVWSGRHSRRFFRFKSGFYGCCCCISNKQSEDEREPNTFFLIFLEGPENEDMTMALSQYAKDHYNNFGIKAVSRKDTEPGRSLRFTIAQFIANCRYALILLPRDNRFVAESQADVELLHAQHTPLETKIFAVTNSPADYLPACVSGLDDLSKKSLELHNLPILPELPLDDESCQRFWETVTQELRLDALSSESGSIDDYPEGYNRI